MVAVTLVCIAVLVFCLADDYLNNKVVREIKELLKKYEENK